MATYNARNGNVESVLHVGELTCDLCSSQDIIETREGYVCRACGVVLELKKLEYHRPYNTEAIQHAVQSSPSQIGTKRERMQYSNNFKLNQLNKLQSIKDDRKKAVFQVARGEIKKIFAGAQLPDGYRNLVLKKFKMIWAKQRPSTKYRNPQKLVPVLIYYTLKEENIPVDTDKIIEVSDITEEEFRGFMKQYTNYDKNYKYRNRIKLILHKIYEVREHFNLDMVFYFQSKKILYKLWNGINNTKDDIITGLVSSITVLCSPELQEKITVGGICRKLGIKMSTIQFQVKNRIFKRLKVKGFESLKKSSDLLRKVLSKLGLYEEIREIVQVEESDFIEIKIGGAEPIFNWNNSLNYYLFAFKDKNQRPVHMSIEYHNNIDVFIEEKKEKERTLPKDNRFDISVWKYYTSRGPPQFVNN